MLCGKKPTSSPKACLPSTKPYVSRPMSFFSSSTVRLRPAAGPAGGGDGGGGGQALHLHVGYCGKQGNGGVSGLVVVVGVRWTPRVLLR